MSGQATLGGFRDPQGEADASAWAPGTDGVCETCGADVPAALARVIGDNDGNVPVCARCASPRNGTDATTTTGATLRARRRR